MAKKSARLTNRNKSQKETISDIEDRVKKRSEGKRKKLVRKTELAIKKIQRAKEKAEKFEDEIESKRLQDQMAEVMKACDEEYREFFDTRERIERRRS